jgi:acyl carrier protein
MSASIIKDIENICRLTLGKEMCLSDTGLTLNSIGVTSKRFLQIIVQVENMFGISFEDENLDFKKFRTVQNLIDYIQIRMK